MDQYITTRIDQLEAQLRQAGLMIAQQQQQIQAVIADLNKYKQYLDKLASVFDMEWSQDVNHWASTQKLVEFRAKPRT